MARRLRAKPSNTLILISGAGVVLLALAWIGLNKPLPGYLVAAGNLPAGAVLGPENSKLVALDLGELSDSYATLEDSESKVLVMPIAAGELIPVRLLGDQTASHQTAIRFTPNLKPANPIVIGSRVAIWQVVELEEVFESQLLVPSALVSDLLYGEGLFAEEFPEVEVIVSSSEAQLLLSAISSDAQIYLLPRS